MLRWDGPEPERPARNGVERDPVPPPQSHPKSSEAHRRTRYFDEETGRIVREDHHAIRTRYRSRPAKPLIGPASGPDLVTAVALSGAAHGSVAWGILAVLAFSPSPWLALPLVLAIPIAMGRRFFWAHVVLVFGLGSFAMAEGAWFVWLGIVLVAGFFGPARWVGGDE